MLVETPGRFTPTKSSLVSKISDIPSMTDGLMCNIDRTDFS